jgi:hypothetical protein
MGWKERMNPFRSKASQQTQARAQRGSVDKQLIQQLQSGNELPIMDTTGRQLHVGDAVIYHPQFPLIFTIASATPVLDPKYPRGTLLLTLACQAPVHIQSGQVWPTALCVGRNGHPLMPVKLEAQTAPTGEPGDNGKVPESASKLVIP